MESSLGMLGQKVFQRFLLGVTISTAWGSLLSPQLAYAQSTQFLNWSQGAWDSILQQVDSLGFQATTAVFNSIDEFGIDRIPLTKKSTLGVRSKREIYDNFDLLNTWTVIDRFTLNIPSGWFGKSVTHALPESVGQVSAGFQLGSDFGVQFTHIRSVPSFQYSKVETIEQLESQLLDHPESDDEPDSPREMALFQDPSIRPRFSKFLSRLTIPFRLPLGLKSFQSLKTGELFSTQGFGALELSASIGAKSLPIPVFKIVSIDLGGSIYLKGQFIITVLKVSDHHAWLKITKAVEAGRRMGISPSHDPYEVFEGFTILKQRIGRTTVSAKPFSISVEKSKTPSFDIAYQYDLSTEQGLSAFRKATHGSLAKTQEILDLEKDQPQEQKSVQPLFNSTSQKKKSITRQSYGVDILLKHHRKHTTEEIHSDIQSQNQTTEVIKVTQRKQTQNGNLYGHSESSRVGLEVHFDSHASAEEKEDGMVILAEKSVQDSRTHLAEMKNYISEVETFVGRPDLFPDFQTFIPPRDQEKRNHYLFGYSSFYYGFSIKRFEIMRFLSANLNEQKTTLLAALQSDPEDLDECDSLIKTRACRFLKTWSDLIQMARYQSPKKISKELSVAFQDRRDIEEWIKIFRIFFGPNKLQYFVTAENGSFGRIQLSTRPQTPTDIAITNASDQSEFEKKPGQFQIDPESTLDQIKVENLDKTPTLSFTATKFPKVMYFRLTRQSGWRGAAILDEILIQNQRELFRAGLNSFEISPTSPHPVGRRLSKFFKSGQRLMLTLGYSQGDSPVRYGPGFSTRFQIPRKP